MGKVRLTNQGGSVATFMIVGIILICGLIGAVYGLKQHGDQVRKDQAIAAYEKQQAEKKASEAKQETSASDSSDNESTGVVSIADDSNSSTELPLTGPELTVSEYLGLSLLVAVSIAYVSSRRQLSLSL